jgi:hypothetical protein
MELICLPSTWSKQVVSSLPKGFVAEQRNRPLSAVSHAVISKVQTPWTYDVK